MAEDTQELSVRIKPEGVSETTDALAEQADQFEETAQTAQEQTGALEAFSERWEGALQVFAAGLAVASASLLSQIPVLGEAFTGLQAIINAVAFAMDEVLRPIFQPLANDLFDLAETINTAEGPMRDLIGVVGVVVSALGILVGGLVAAGAAAGPLASAWGVLTTVGSAVAGIITTVIGVIAGLPAALVLAVVAVVAFAAAYLTNFNGIRDKTNAVLARIFDLLSQLGTWLAERLIAFLGIAADGFAAAFNAILTSAVQFGGQLIGTFVRALDTLVERLMLFRATVRTAFEVLGDLVVAALKTMANRAVRAIERAINAAVSAIPAEVRGAVGISSVNLGTPFDPESARSIRRRGERRLERRRGRIRRDGDDEVSTQVDQLVQALQNATQQININLDGQTVAENQEQFLGENTINRGRGR